MYLSDSELDSVAMLSCVRKAVYLMQSEMDPTRYRFGGIGAVDGQANTPLRRLGQCTDAAGGVIRNTWRFLVMVELPHETTGAQVRSLESVIREFFFSCPGVYGGCRIARKDALVTLDAPQLVAETFRAALGF